MWKNKRKAKTFTSRRTLGRMDERLGLLLQTGKIVMLNFGQKGIIAQEDKVVG